MTTLFAAARCFQIGTLFSGRVVSIEAGSPEEVLGGGQGMAMLMENLQR